MVESGTAVLQQMMSESGNRARVIAIASGKGGVGKTNIAVNLSLCMAAANKKVFLIDGDLGLGNLDVIMNIDSRYDLSDVIFGDKKLDEITVVGPCGVEVITGGSGVADMADMGQFQRSRLINELDDLQNNCDLMLIDTAAGINQSVVGFCLAADDVLVVTTPEPTAMTDAYAMIKVLCSRQYEGRISLVVNMANSLAEGKKVYRQLAEVARRFLDVVVYEAGAICHDDKLAASVRMRKPVVLEFPGARVTSSLVAMAARLSKSSAARISGDGFFKKVVNWFF